MQNSRATGFKASRPYLADFEYESLSNRSKITSSNSSSRSIVVTAGAVVFVVIGAEAAVVV